MTHPSWVTLAFWFATCWMSKCSNKMFSGEILIFQRKKLHTFFLTKPPAKNVIFNRKKYPSFANCWQNYKRSPGLFFKSSLFLKTKRLFIRKILLCFSTYSSSRTKGDFSLFGSHPFFLRRRKRRQPSQEKHNPRFLEDPPLHGRGNGKLRWYGKVDPLIILFIFDGCWAK